ncbi:hypothetical protein FQA39_LY11225 [Lamprigera yunnana]|nr:hypothetical protein FQA39_LY11225 [Lamprigera yunnana]
MQQQKEEEEEDEENEEEEKEEEEEKDEKEEEEQELNLNYVGQVMVKTRLGVDDLVDDLVTIHKNRLRTKYVEVPKVERTTDPSKENGKQNIFAAEDRDTHSLFSKTFDRKVAEPENMR